MQQHALVGTKSYYASTSCASTDQRPARWIEQRPGQCVRPIRCKLSLHHSVCSAPRGTMLTFCSASKRTCSLLRVQSARPLGSLAESRPVLRASGCCGRRRCFDCCRTLLPALIGDVVALHVLRQHSRCCQGPVEPCACGTWAIAQSTLSDPRIRCDLTADAIHTPRAKMIHT